MVALMLDADGRPANLRPGGLIRLGSSDPHLGLADIPLEGPITVFNLTRASSRRGLPLAVRATATSTTIGGFWTSSLNVEPLEL